MKRVLLIAHFCNDFDLKGNNRFNYLADLMSSSHDVTLVTSDFSHKKKQYRTCLETDKNFKIVTIHEPAYKKNISLKRLYSHRIFGKNLLKYLKNLKEKPDVIYCAVPSLDAAKSAAKYAKKNNIKFIVDIQDLWPEAFQMALNIPGVFLPMKISADYSYSRADEIVAVSKTYSNRAKLVNSHVSETYPVFIGTNLKQFDENVKHNIVTRADNEFWVGYCGSLANSYDVKCIIEAISLLQTSGYNNIRFQIMGEGFLKNSLIELADQKGIKAEFTGHIPYPEMCGLLSACDIAVNPIVEKSVSSIINKHSDYVAAGLPIINIQSNREFGDLLTEYKAGFACKPGDVTSIANAIETLYNDKNQRIEMGKNARRLAEEKFDRAYTYNKIIELIEK